MTIGEAHKIGLTAIGRDINPVAVESVRVSLGQADENKIQTSFDELSRSIGKRFIELYRSKAREVTLLMFYTILSGNAG